MFLAIITQFLSSTDFRYRHYHVLISTAVCNLLCVDVIYHLTYLFNVFFQVGTEFIRGISGGERKRTNIGMELITSPPVLFLDEPTTGLDASTAIAVMTILHR
jgi:ABC-type dipeptide/oligopeptide/nickel transport system ATPase subunit